MSWTRSCLHAALVLLPVAAAAQDVPCGGLELRAGRVVMATPLSPADYASGQGAACVKAVGTRLLANPRLRSVTLALRLGDEERAKGGGTALVDAVAKQLALEGVPRERIYTLVTAAQPSEKPSIQWTFTERSPVPPVGQFSAAGGDVRVGAEPGKGAAVGAGGVVTAGQWVETGKDGRAILVLQDGSTVRLGPGSRLRVGTMGVTPELKRRVELELPSGDVEVQASPGGDGSIFEIHTPNAVAGVRGTAFHLALPDDGASRLETNEGKVNLGTIAGTANADVPAGQGTRVTQVGVLEAPRVLLPVPQPLAPLTGPVTVDARLALSWSPVEGATSYRVELARDAGFVNSVQTALPLQASLSLKDAAPGRWFWRVRAVDKDGFESAPSKIYAFKAQL